MTTLEALVREKYPNANDQHIAEALVYAGEPKTDDPEVIQIFFDRVNDYFRIKMSREVYSESWQPTCNLRWIYRSKKFDPINLDMILQQMWQGSQGNQKWEDIPIVTE
jgi:hypothetical protein